MILIHNSPAIVEMSAEVWVDFLNVHLPATIPEECPLLPVTHNLLIPGIRGSICRRPCRLLSKSITYIGWCLASTILMVLYILDQVYQLWPDTGIPVRVKHSMARAGKML